MKGNLTEDGQSALFSLAEDILSRAEGVFLWVRLVSDEMIEGLCEGDSPEELRDVLSGIPSELEGLYTRALCRNSRHKTRATGWLKYERYMMFQIVMCSQEPFPLHHLLAATCYLATGTHTNLKTISLDQMQRRLYSRGSGLLDAPEQDYGSRHGHLEVQFIHQTLKGYMISGEGMVTINIGLGDKVRTPVFLSLPFKSLLSHPTCPSITAALFPERIECRYSRKRRYSGSSHNCEYATFRCTFRRLGG